MDEQSFSILEQECARSLELWIEQARKTCEMLTECASKAIKAPLPLEQRSVLSEQRMRENDAQSDSPRYRVGLTR